MVSQPEEEEEATELATQGLPAAAPGDPGKRQPVPAVPGVWPGECQPCRGSLAIWETQPAAFALRDPGWTQLGGHSPLSSSHTHPGVTVPTLRMRTLRPQQESPNEPHPAAMQACHLQRSAPCLEAEKCPQHSGRGPGEASIVIIFAISKWEPSFHGGARPSLWQVGHRVPRGRHRHPSLP